MMFNDPQMMLEPSIPNSITLIFNYLKANKHCALLILKDRNYFSEKKWMNSRIRGIKPIISRKILVLAKRIP